MKHINIIEAATQVLVGTVCIFFSNLLVFPFLDIEATISSNAILVAVNTFVAFIKSYAVRSFFKKVENETN